jgi:hypothetical protein
MTAQPIAAQTISLSALHLHMAACLATERGDQETAQAITHAIHAATRAETLLAIQECAKEAASRTWEESIPFRRSASDVALAALIAGQNERRSLCLFSELTPVLSGYMQIENHKATYVDTGGTADDTVLVDLFDMPNVADMLLGIRSTSRSTPTARMPTSGISLLHLEDPGLAVAAGDSFYPLEFLLLNEPKAPTTGARFRSLPGIRGSVCDGYICIYATPESMIETHAAASTGSWFFLRSANIHVVGKLPDLTLGSSERVRACYVGNDSRRPEPNVKNCLVSLPEELATHLLRLHPWLLPMTPMDTLRILPLLDSLR